MGETLSSRKQILESLLALLLIAFWPFFNFYAANLKQDPSIFRLFVVYGIYITFVAVLFMIFRPVLRKKFSFSQQAALFALLNIVFFNFNLFKPYGYGAWFVAFILTIWLFARWVKKYSLIPVLISIGLALNVVPVLKIFRYEWLLKKPVSARGDLSEFEGLQFQSHPNIYYILIDGYASPTQMKKYTGLDVQPFIERLESKGFVVTHKSHANYPHTYLSLSAALESRYVVEVGKGVIQNRAPFYPIIQGNSRSAQFFKKYGYQYLHFENGFWDGSQCGGFEDHCLKRNRFALTEMGKQMFSLTPLLSIWSQVEQWAFFKVDGIGLRSLYLQLQPFFKEQKPFFVFAHIFSPHPPYYLHSDCSLREEVLGGWTPEPYREQAECVNKKIGVFLDKILKKDPEALIILHSDHGTAFQDQFSKLVTQWTDDEIAERTQIFSAFRLPESCKKLAYESISPVNNIRLVLSCLSGEKPKYLPDRVFLTANEGEPDYGDVIEVSEK